MGVVGTKIVEAKIMVVKKGQDNKKWSIIDKEGSASFPRGSNSLKREYSEV